MLYVAKMPTPPSPSQDIDKSFMLSIVVCMHHLNTVVINVMLKVMNIEGLTLCISVCLNFLMDEKIKHANMYIVNME